MKKRSPRRNRYIVTEDLSILVPRWCRGLEPSIPIDAADPLFDELLVGLKKALARCWTSEDDVTIVIKKHGAFDTTLDKGFSTNGGDFPEFWVSLDDVYPKFADGDPNKGEISITRYVDTGWKKLDGHHPRPEWTKESIEDQIDSLCDKLRTIKRKYSKQKLSMILIDDGTFEGGTMRDVLDKFRQRHIFFEEIRLGVAKFDGMRAIERWWGLDEEKLKQNVKSVKVGEDFFQAEDWVCERDFFPGVLYAGKVVADQRRNRITPIKVGKDLPVRAQYLHHWGNITDWASIPSDAVLPFTTEVLTLSIRLWEHLEDLRKKSLRTKGLKEKHILVQDLPAIPHKLYHRNRQRMQEVLRKRWLDVLKCEYEELADRL